MAIANPSTISHAQNSGPFCGAVKPVIYSHGAFFSAYCCEVFEQESEAREDLVPFERISIVASPALAQTNWQHVCQVLGGAT